MIWFTVREYDPELEERLPCNSDQHPTPNVWAAQICAAYYFAKHDGGERSWPLTFVLFESDIEVGRFIVSCEPQPVFRARDITASGAVRKDDD
jgi:hypothetical protein